MISFAVCVKHDFGLKLVSEASKGSNLTEDHKEESS